MGQLPTGMRGVEAAASCPSKIEEREEKERAADIEKLKGALNSPNEKMRERAIRNIVRMDAKEALPELIKRFDDKEWYVAAAALDAVAKLGATEAVDSIIEKLEDPKWNPGGLGDKRMDIAAIRALGELKAIKAIPTILKHADAGDKELLTAVTVALSLIGVQEANPFIPGSASIGFYSFWASLFEKPTDVYFEFNDNKNEWGYIKINASEETLVIETRDSRFEIDRLSKVVSDGRVIGAHSHGGPHGEMQTAIVDTRIKISPKTIGEYFNKIDLIKDQLAMAMFFAQFDSEKREIADILNCLEMLKSVVYEENRQLKAQDQTARALEKITIKYPELKKMDNVNGHWTKEEKCYKSGCHPDPGFQLTLDTKLGKATYKAGTTIKFHSPSLAKEDAISQALSGILAGDQVIDGVKFKGGTEILFRNNGKVSLGILAENQKFVDIMIKAGEVSFHDTGKLHSGILSGTQTIQGIKYQGGTRIVLSDGKVYEGILAEKLKYPNCLPGSMIYFNKPDKPECEGGK